MGRQALEGPKVAVAISLPLSLINELNERIIQLNSADSEAERQQKLQDECDRVTRRMLNEGRGVDVINLKVREMRKAAQTGIIHSRSSVVADALRAYLTAGDAGGAERRRSKKPSSKNGD